MTVIWAAETPAVRGLHSGDRAPRSGCTSEGAQNAWSQRMLRRMAELIKPTML